MVTIFSVTPGLVYFIKHIPKELWGSFLFFLIIAVLHIECSYVWLNSHDLPFNDIFNNCGTTKRDICVLGWTPLDYKGCPNLSLLVIMDLCIHASLHWPYHNILTYKQENKHTQGWCAVCGGLRSGVINLPNKHASVQPPPHDPSPQTHWPVRPDNFAVSLISSVPTPTRRATPSAVVNCLQLLSDWNCFS